MFAEFGNQNNTERNLPCCLAPSVVPPSCCFPPLSLRARVHACSVTRSRVTLRPRGLEPARLLCHGILQGGMGVGCHFLLQGIFPTQGSNPHLLHCRWILYHWTTREALVPEREPLKSFATYPLCFFIQIQADGLALAFYFLRYPGKLFISLKGASFLLTVMLYSLCGCTTIYLAILYGHILALFLIFFFF